MPHDRRSIRGAMVASFAIYVVFGLADGVFGTVWPNLRDHFGRTNSSLGFLIFCSAVGYLCGSVSSGHLAERLGIGRLLPLAMVLATLALIAVGAATSWWIVGVGYVALGFGWGITDAGLNVWMTLTQGPREMGLLHASYGVGAFLGPLLATVFVADDASWRAPFVVCVVLTLVAVAGLVRSRRGFAAAPTSAAVVAAVGAPQGSHRLLVLMMGWFSLYAGLEVAIGTWSFTLLTEGRDKSEVFAGVLTAAFWGALMMGRFVLAVLGHRLSPERTVRGSTALALMAALVLWADPAGAGWIALPVMGLALSMMFPVVMGRTAIYLGEARAPRAVGYQIGAAAVGFTALPALIGVLADAYGVGSAAPVFVATVVVVGALWLAIERTIRPAPGRLRSAS